MHELVDTGISTLLLALGIAFIIGFLLPIKLKERLARRVEAVKLRGHADDVGRSTEGQSTLRSPPVRSYTQKKCAFCLNPSRKVCSRCKAARYCSRECQRDHWKQGHKYECVPVKAGVGRSSAKAFRLVES